MKSSVLILFEQQTVNQVLEYHVEWFEKIGFTVEQVCPLIFYDC